MSNQPDLDAATDFVGRNARLLDRHRFAFHFLTVARLQQFRAYGRIA